MTKTTPPTDAAVDRADLVWAAVVPAQQAIRKVARRVTEPVDLTARLYHHPFLGLVFVCRPLPPRLPRLPGRSARVGTAPVAAHVAVDLVSGRAYLADPWDDDSFTSLGAALDAAGQHGAPAGNPVNGPAPRIEDQGALDAGRRLLAGALARRRRLDGLGPAELHTPPVRFGKPNWWVTGQCGQRRIEVIVDGLSGRHYVCSG